MYGYMYDITEINETMKNDIVCWCDHVRIQYFYFDFCMLFSIFSINYVEEHGS